MGQVGPPARGGAVAPVMGRAPALVAAQVKSARAVKPTRAGGRPGLMPPVPGAYAWFLAPVTAAPEMAAKGTRGRKTEVAGAKVEPARPRRVLRVGVSLARAAAGVAPVASR